MLRTNLSTRPFYNERLVRVALLATGALIVALSIFNVVEVRSLSARHADLVGRVRQSEERAVQLREQAAQARRSIDRKELEAVGTAAREANALIDQRTFSWTELLNRLETTLPADVRIESIRPSTDRDGHLTVAVVVLARRAEDVETFVEALQGSGTFLGLFSRTETTTPQGLLEVALEGRYMPVTRQLSTAAGSGSKPKK
ncbi:MAG TPA: PilN domain-containing protein [Vicinamibacterales bacterium]|jgi:Tfp pilus assembly protein PilN